jgi:hypothetical protein
MSTRDEIERELIRFTRLGYLTGWERKRTATGTYYRVEFAGRATRTYSVPAARGLVDGLSFAVPIALTFQQALRLRGQEGR